jgi:hypothetical protein
MSIRTTRFFVPWSLVFVLYGTLTSTGGLRSVSIKRIATAVDVEGDQSRPTKIVMSFRGAPSASSTVTRTGWSLIAVWAPSHDPRPTVISMVSIPPEVIVMLPPADADVSWLSLPHAGSNTAGEARTTRHKTEITLKESFMNPSL